MWAIILAGGKGTRLRPLTLDVPKPVVPLANRPFLAHQLATLRAAGVRKAVLSLSYRPDAVQEAVRGFVPRGLTLEYTVEDEPLGTGGAVRFAAAGREETLVVLNGDVLSTIDLRAVIAQHRRRRSRATIVLTPVEDPTAYGLVQLARDGRVQGFLEKPSWEEVSTNTINAGVYVIEPELLRFFPPGHCSIERDFFPRLVQERVPFHGFVHGGYWLDFGTSEKYLQAHRDLLEEPGRTFPGYRRRGTGLWLGTGARCGDRVLALGRALVGARTELGDGVQLHKCVVVGRGCRIGARAVLENCVLWDGVEVGEDARLKGCVLGDRVRIGVAAHLQRLVLGRGAVLPDYSRLHRLDAGE
jgi:NDP-sugar pyrophosphorylase family protein